MREEQTPPRTQATPSASHGVRTAKDARASRARKAGLTWLAGAVAAAVLAGGGYYIWKGYGHSNGGVAVMNTPAFEQSAPARDATMAGDVPGAGVDATAPPQTKRRVAAAKIPEETIGVSRAAAQASQDSNEVVVRASRPVWRRAPSAERLSEYYPVMALERGREGEASLRCVIQERGALDCERISESPARAGFGAAALRVAHTFRHAPQRADGRDALGTSIHLRVLFRMADDERRG